MSNEQFPWDDLDDVGMSGLDVESKFECVPNLSQRAAQLVEENRALHALLQDLCNTRRSREEIEMDYLYMFNFMEGTVLPGTVIALRLIEELAANWNHPLAPSPGELFAYIYQYAHTGLNECERSHNDWASKMLKHYIHALDGGDWDLPGVGDE